MLEKEQNPPVQIVTMSELMHAVGENRQVDEGDAGTPTQFAHLLREASPFHALSSLARGPPSGRSLRSAYDISSMSPPSLDCCRH